MVTGAGCLVGEMGVRTQGVVGTSVAGVRARGATSPFDGVTVGLGGMQTGCAGVTRLSGGRGARLGLAKEDWGFVGRKSLGLGTGPIDVSTLVAQSNSACPCGAGLAAALAVGDGAGSVVLLSHSRIPWSSPSLGWCTSLPTSV